MALPATIPVWASDTNIASGTEIGTPTKVDVGAGAFGQGFVPGELFKGQRVNYVLYHIIQHVLWARSFAAGLDAAFNAVAWAWTGLQTWSALGRFTGGLRANTLQLQADASYTDGAGTSAPATRVITMPWVEGAGHNTFSSGTVPDGPTTGVVDGVLVVTSNGTFTASGSASKGINLPQGAVLTGWRVLSKPSQGNFNYQFELRSRVINFNAPGAAASTLIGATQSQAGVAGTYYTKGQSGLSTTIVANTMLYISADIMSSPAPPNEYELDLVGVELTYTETRATGSH